MKRTVSWILSVIMVVTCLAALFTVTASADVVNVAAGKPVTYTNARPTAEAEGYAGDITDGVTPGPDYSNNWRAFLNGTGTAVIDLGETVEDLTGAAVWLWASNQGDGITKPGYIKFFVSDDNEDWLPLSEADLSDPLLNANPSNPMWVVADFPGGISGRYVKMEVKTVGGFTFVGEVQVLTGGPASEATYKWYAIKTFAGYAEGDVNIFVRKGEADTVNKVRLALNAASKTYSWYGFIYVNSDGIIDKIEAPDSSGDKSNSVIPEGGCIIGIHTVNWSAFDGTVGQRVVIKGTDLETLAGYTAVRNLTGVSFCTRDLPHEHTFEDETFGRFLVNTCSVCGAKEVTDLEGNEIGFIQISHINRYNWATFESMIVTHDAFNNVNYATNTTKDALGYIVTETGEGDYQVTEYLGERYDVAAPEDGFLLYIFPANADYAKAQDGALLGSRMYPDFDLGTDASIDTHAGGVPMPLYCIAGETPELDLDEVFENFGADDDWTEVTLDTGYIQGGQAPEGADLSYSYCYKVEDGVLYGAAVINCLLTEGGNGNGTNFRTWFHQDPEAQLYTHFIDVYAKDGAVATNAKYNASLTSNAGTDIEGETGLTASIKGVYGKVAAEFSVPLATVGADDDENLEIYVAVSDKPAGGTNVCLYQSGAPKVNEDQTVNYNGNLPAACWDAEHALYIPTGFTPEPPGPGENDTSAIAGLYYGEEYRTANDYREITMGDLDGNGEVEAVDYLMVKRRVLGTYELTDAQFLAADVDFSGAVEAVDYLMVKRKVLGTFEMPELPEDHAEFFLTVNADGTGRLNVKVNGERYTAYELLIEVCEDDTYNFCLYRPGTTEEGVPLHTFMFVPTEDGGRMGMDDYWIEFESVEPIE
ncbi:MAG: hypothetical protein J5793_01970 [Clostridia bacterium]|nr:hypothetical protein [Clostridia bacterium]